MTIKNKTTIMSASTAIFMAMILAFGNFVPIIQNVNATSSGSPSVDCASKFTPLEYSTIQSMDKNKARLLSDNDGQLQSKIKGHNSEYSSMFTEWSWNPADCSNLTLDNVDMVYTLKDTTGKYLKHVIVTLDPSLTKTLAVTEQNANVVHGHALTNWAGYELSPTSGAYVQEATISWTMPTVSSPSGKNCATNVCSAAFWTGIEDAGQGSNHLVQAGTDQNVTCGGCGSNDYVWYEALNDKTVYCTGYSYHHGNSVFSDITNENKTNSANKGKYDFTIADNTQGVQCTGTIDYSGFMTSGTYGVFQVERPTYHTGTAYLAQFTNSTSMGIGWMYFGGANHKIGTFPASTTQDYMQNSGYLNADTSSISSGSFNLYYHNSNGQ